MKIYKLDPKFNSSPYFLHPKEKTHQYTNPNKSQTVKQKKAPENLNSSAFKFHFPIEKLDIKSIKMHFHLYS